MSRIGNQDQHNCYNYGRYYKHFSLRFSTLGEMPRRQVGY
jgi:hypothetical protein